MGALKARPQEQKVLVGLRISLGGASVVGGATLLGSRLGLGDLVGGVLGGHFAGLDGANVC